jgi:hypothetical protein
MIRVKYKFICCWHKSVVGLLFVLHHIRAVSSAFNFPFPLQSFCLLLRYLSGMEWYSNAQFEFQYSFTGLITGHFF